MFQNLERSYFRSSQFAKKFIFWENFIFIRATDIRTCIFGNIVSNSFITNDLNLNINAFQSIKDVIFNFKCFSKAYLSSFNWHH